MALAIIGGAAAAIRFEVKGMGGFTIGTICKEDDDGEGEGPTRDCRYCAEIVKIIHGERLNRQSFQKEHLFRLPPS